MIELRRSPVDGMWRAWAEINCRELFKNPSTNATRWVCVAVTCDQQTALWQGLKVMRRFSP
jgi:hypothetical protein